MPFALHLIVVLIIIVSLAGAVMLRLRNREREQQHEQRSPSVSGRPLAALFLTGTLLVTGCGSSACASNPINPQLADANQKAVQSIVADNERLVVQAALGEAEAASHKERNEAALAAAQRLVEESRKGKTP